jgi:hypothetical protein
MLTIVEVLTFFLLHLSESNYFYFCLRRQAVLLLVPVPSGAAIRKSGSQPGGPAWAVVRRRTERGGGRSDAGSVDPRLPCTRQLRDWTLAGNAKPGMGTDLALPARPARRCPRGFEVHSAGGLRHSADSARKPRRKVQCVHCRRNAARGADSSLRGLEQLEADAVPKTAVGDSEALIISRRGTVVKRS